MAESGVMATNLSFLSHHITRDGYGYAGLKIVEALRAEGVSVRAMNLATPSGQYTDWSEVEWQVDGPAVALCLPEWWPSIKTERLLGYTMFESTGLPVGRVGAINQTADMCLVPCEWCRETFIENGVQVPVEVVPLGVDLEDYPLMDRAGRDGADEGPYTFLWSGTPDYRKGWDLVYRAFWRAFGKAKDVRLVLHFRALPTGLVDAQDGNVEIIEGLVERSVVRRMLFDADVFVFPSRGEGWGLPPREAAMTGLPVIATNWGGLAEEIRNWALPLMVAEMRPAEFGPWDAGEVGLWAEPDLDHLVHLMRWCYENRNEARARGIWAAQWLHEHGTWARTARGIMEVVQC